MVFGHSLITVRTITVSTRVFVFVFLGSFLAHVNFILYETKSFCWSLMMGSKLKGVSGFGVGVIQDYVVTDVY